MISYMRACVRFRDFREEEKKESRQNRCHPDRNFTQKWKDLSEKWKNH